jgi:hypothetical protein
LSRCTCQAWSEWWTPYATPCASEHHNTPPFKRPRQIGRGEGADYNDSTGHGCGAFHWAYNCLRVLRPAVERVVDAIHATLRFLVLYKPPPWVDQSDGLLRRAVERVVDAIRATVRFWIFYKGHHAGGPVRGC